MWSRHGSNPSACGRCPTFLTPTFCIPRRERSSRNWDCDWSSARLTEPGNPRPNASLSRGRWIAGCKLSRPTLRGVISITYSRSQSQNGHYYGAPLQFWSEELRAVEIGQRNCERCRTSGISYGMACYRSLLLGSYPTMYKNSLPMLRWDGTLANQSRGLHVRPKNRKLDAGCTMAAGSVLCRPARRTGAAVLHADPRVQAPDAHGLRRPRSRRGPGHALDAGLGAAGESGDDSRGLQL